MTAETPALPKVFYTDEFPTPTLARRNRLYVASCPVTGLVAVSNNDKLVIFLWKRVPAAQVLGDFQFVCAVEAPGCDAVMAFTLQHTEHGATTPPHLIIRLKAPEGAPGIRFLNCEEGFTAAAAMLEGHIGPVTPLKVATSNTTLATLDAVAGKPDVGVSVYTGGGIHWVRTHVVSGDAFAKAVGGPLACRITDMTDVCFGKDGHLLILENGTWCIFEMTFAEHRPEVVATYPIGKPFDFQGQYCIRWEDPFILLAGLNDPRYDGIPIDPDVGLRMLCRMGAMDTSTKPATTSLALNETLALAKGVRDFRTPAPVLSVLTPIGILVADPIPASVGLQFCLVPWFAFQCKPEMSAFRLAWIIGTIRSVHEQALIAESKFEALRLEGEGEYVDVDGGGLEPDWPSSKKQREGEP